MQTANTTSAVTAPIFNLPLELLEAILIALPYPALSHARHVSRAWRTICDSNVIPPARKRLLELHHLAQTDPSIAIIRHRIEPFLVDFDRSDYLARIDLDIPFEFTCWVLETPLSDLIGWHWPGLHGEHSRDRHDALGVDFISAMMFSRHLKPGYTLLPSANVMEVEDPDYSAFNDTDLHFYPGSWQCQRTMRQTKCRALQVWADMSGFAPKITLLILSGSERWDGCVWETESRTAFRHSPEAITVHQGVQLTWRRMLGTWTEYLRGECKGLGERYASLDSLKTYRTMNGRMYISAMEEL